MLELLAGRGYVLPAKRELELLEHDLADPMPVVRSGPVAQLWQHVPDCLAERLMRRNHDSIRRRVHDTGGIHLEPCDHSAFETGSAECRRVRRCRLSTARLCGAFHLVLEECARGGTRCAVHAVCVCLQPALRSGGPGRDEKRDD